MREKLEVLQRRYVLEHPYLSYLSMFIGIPMGLVLAVSLITAFISLPLALIFGWA